MAPKPEPSRRIVADNPSKFTAWGTGTYFVGSAENVAAAMSSVAERAGIDIWILSGWPLAREAEITAELLLPLLATDRSTRLVDAASAR